MLRKNAYRNRVILNVTQKASCNYTELDTRRASWYGNRPSAMCGNLSCDVTIRNSNRLTCSNPLNLKTERWCGSQIEQNWVKRLLYNVLDTKIDPRWSSEQYPAAPLTTPTIGSPRKNKGPIIPLWCRWRTKRAAPAMTAASVPVNKTAELWPFSNLFLLFYPFCWSNL